MRLTYVRGYVRRTRLRAIPLAMSMKNCQHAPQYKYGSPLGSSALNVCKKNRDRPTPGKPKTVSNINAVPPKPSSGSVNSMRGHSPPPPAQGIWRAFVILSVFRWGICFQKERNSFCNRETQIRFQKERNYTYTELIPKSHSLSTPETQTL